LLTSGESSVMPTHTYFFEAALQLLGEEHVGSFAQPVGAPAANR
jgi:hypothetical protein